LNLFLNSSKIKYELFVRKLDLYIDIIIL